MLHNLISHIETHNDTSSRSSTLVSSVGSLIQLAITHGADITIKNEAGKSAFDLCSDPNSKEHMRPGTAQPKRLAEANKAPAGPRNAMNGR